MKILPDELKPPREPTRLRHQPHPGRRGRGYRAFHSCLRWDFGFTCAFCLLHEADLLVSGEAARGGMVMTVEHFIPRRLDPTRSYEYSNCLYVCRFCNRARSDRPVVDGSGRRLLNPSREIWADHFISTEGELRPREGDADAAYTAEVYDLNAPIKVYLRRFRKNLYADRLPVLHDGTEKLERLLAKAKECFDKDRELALTLIEAAQELRRVIVNDRAELSWYSAIPADAPARCLCGSTEHHSIPPGLERQMIDLPEDSAVA